MALPLSEVVALLERIAPLELAEDWDNVGLLVEPSALARGERGVSRALFTIDLTGPVLAEATALGADLIVAYHPPIFRGLKRLDTRAESRVVLEALEARIAVYSPHTALDAAQGGLGDWLAECAGPGRVRVVSPAAGAPNSEFKLVVFVPRANLAALRAALCSEPGVGRIGEYSECSFALDGTGTFFGGEASSPVVGQKGQLESVDEVRLELVCARDALLKLPGLIAAHHPYEEPAWDLYPLAPKPRPGAGVGRFVELDEPAPLEALLDRIQRHLGLDALRVAASERHRSGVRVASLCVCPGSGGALFERVQGADLFVTGEMRHHDVLAKLARGASVVLSEHTHTERGYLPRFAARLGELAPGLESFVSERDADPLTLRR